MRFTLKELLSVVCDIKVEYEIIYGEKSLAIKTRNGQYGLTLVDKELGKYKDLKEKVAKYKPYSCMDFGSELLIQSAGNLPIVRSLTGEEFAIFALNKNSVDIDLPEMTAQYLAMYLLGMASRYYPKEWGEITEGKTSGDIYAIRKFLEITERKFPNLILNSLWGREFVFLSPKLEEEQRVSASELERINEYVKRKRNDEFRMASAGLF